MILLNCPIYRVDSNTAYFDPKGADVPCTGYPSFTLQIPFPPCSVAGNPNWEELHQAEHLNFWLLIVTGQWEAQPRTSRWKEEKVVVPQLLPYWSAGCRAGSLNWRPQLLSAGPPIKLCVSVGSDNPPQTLPRTPPGLGTEMASHWW